MEQNVGASAQARVGRAGGRHGVPVVAPAGQNTLHTKRASSANSRSTNATDPDQEIRYQFGDSISFLSTVSGCSSLQLGEVLPRFAKAAGDSALT